MFGGFLELTLKSGTKPDLLQKVRDEILPVMRTYKGFYELIPMDVKDDPTKIYFISLWRDEADAEKYHSDMFLKEQQISEPFLAAPMSVKKCTIDETITSKKLIAVAA